MIGTLTGFPVLCSWRNDSNVVRKRKKVARRRRRSVSHTTPLFSIVTSPDRSLVSIGTVEEVDKFSRRQVRVTKEHNEECRKLLGLMGIPVVVVRHFCLSHFFILTHLSRRVRLHPKQKLNARNWHEGARYSILRSSRHSYSCLRHFFFGTGVCRWLRGYGHTHVQHAHPPSTPDIQRGAQGAYLRGQVASRVGRVGDGYASGERRPLCPKNSMSKRNNMFIFTQKNTMGPKKT